VDFLPKVKIEVVVTERMLEGAIEAIVKAATYRQDRRREIFVSTGGAGGAGIRTGETNEAAV